MAKCLRVHSENRLEIPCEVSHSCGRLGEAGMQVAIGKH